MYPRSPKIEIILPRCHEYKRESRAYLVMFTGREGKSEPSGVTEIVVIDPAKKGQVMLCHIPQDGRYQHIEIYRTFTDNNGTTDYRLAATLGMGARKWADRRRTLGKKLIF